MEFSFSFSLRMSPAGTFPEPLNPVHTFMLYSQIYFNIMIHSPNSSD
jgi:hypothetical protein